MNTRMRTLSLCLVCASSSVAHAQASAGPSLPGTTASGAQPTVARKLDDIRAELKKKQAETQGQNVGMGPVTPGMEPDAGMAGEGMGGMSGGEGGGDPFAAPPGGMMGGMGMGMGMGMSMESSEKQLLGMFIQQLRTRLESKDHKREVVEKQLRAALQQYFQLDMEERVQAFDKIKARVNAMESKLQRRLENESEIVDLQVKQMLYKADGLDFAIPGNNGYGMGGMPGMGGMSGMMGGGMDYGMMGQMEGQPLGVTQQGYDITFGLTRFQRLDQNDLDAQESLKSYADIGAFSTSSFENVEQQMKSLLAALHGFEGRFLHFPRSDSRLLQSQPPHSWRVAILPLIGHGELYKQYRFDEPWDSQQNMQVAAKMPAIYKSSKGQKDATSFMMLVGGGAFGSTRAPTRMADVTDGTSNTIALILADREVPWTKPEDVTYSASEPLPGLNDSRIVGMADGSVQTLGDITTSNFHALITRAGGEVVPAKP